MKKPRPGRAPARRYLALCLGAAVFGAAASQAEAQEAERGEAVYRAWCAECHGETGEGDGPSADWMLPPPRDFTGARYKIRTTGSGELPTDADLHEVIREGLPGTTMPGWPDLSETEREAVIEYIKSFAPFFEGATPEPLEPSGDPGASQEAIEAGRGAYETLECNRCHGAEGRGDGTSAPTLEDWRGNPIRAADLTQPWLFRGGSSPEEIHTRFLSGLDGTPMPSNQDAMEAGIVTEEELWGLAHYVRSLAQDRIPPSTRDAFLVERVGDDRGLPDDPDDPIWEEVESYYVPLSGQVLVPPRNFAPMVTAIWVQGVHDGTELALRVVWNDPSRSPDPQWGEWQEKVARTLHTDEGEIPVAPLPDALTVQFPFEVTEERERPYFLMGDRRRPVYLWRWDSEDGIGESSATGLGTGESLEENALTGEAVWEAGQWRVLFRRGLEIEEDAGPTFSDGTAIPVAFHARDGSSGEDEGRGSLSSWFFLFLEEPESNVIYVAPALVMLLTGGAGLFAIRRARSGAGRRREPDGSGAAGRSRDTEGTRHEAE